MSRYSKLIVEPCLLALSEAGRYVGCPALLARMEKAGWIKPVVRRKKMTLFKRIELDRCCDRLEHDFPEPVQS